MFKENMELLKGEMSNELVKAQEQVTVLQNRMATMDLMVSEYDADVKAAEEKGYEEGLAKATGEPPTDARYTDAEVNQFIADAKAPLEAQIADLQLRVSDMQAQVDSMPNQMETAKSEAVAAFKADVLAKYEESQTKENEAEKSFADLLKG